MSSAMTKVIRDKKKRPDSAFTAWIRRKSKSKLCRIYFLSFMIPLVVMIAMAVAAKIYPFGTKCFLRTDLYNQYLPFFTELQRKIRSGENLFYSWNMGAGADFMAVYAYYLASPLNWLIALVPTVHLTEAMTIMIFFKIALCGVSACYFFVHHFHDKRYSMVGFAIFYALSGFMAAYNWNIMWLDPVFLAPLIVSGLEALVQEKKWMLYTITLGLSILINYYISILICITLVLYFIILILYIPWKEKGRSLLMFGGCSVVAALMAGIVMFPGVMGIMGTGFAKPDFPDKISVYFNALQVISRHLVNVNTDISNDHWPNIYCGVGVLFLFPFYVSCRQISWKQKIPNIILLGIFIAAFSINTLNFIWHGMNYPDSLPARQSFLYILFLLMMCYEAFTHVQEASKVHLIICLAVGGGLIALAQFFNGNPDAFTKNNAVALSAMFLAVYAIFGAAYLKRAVDYQLLVSLMLIFMTFEAGINTFNTSISTVTRSKYISKYEANRDINLSLQEKDPGFYRIEENNRMTKNDAPLSGFKSATMFSSTIESGIENFYKEMGHDYSKVYYSFDGGTPLTFAMMGVRYLITDGDNDWSDTFLKFDQTKDGYNVYRDTASMSIGYAVPADLEDKWIYTDGTAIQTQNSLGACLGVQDQLFTEVDTQTLENLTTVSAEADGTIYVQITGATKDNADKVKITVTSESGEVRRTKTYGNVPKGYLMSLGYCQKGDQVTLTAESGSMAEVIVSAYRMNDTAMQSALDKLGASQLQIEKVGASSLQGKISVTQDSRLVLSIPYDKGWTILVDGKEQQVDQFAGAFPSVNLTAGDHEISMHYVPVGTWTGIGMTAVGLAIFGVLVYVGKKKRISRR